MQPNTKMSYCHVAIGLAILACGCIDDPPIQAQHELEPVLMVRNVTFANNTIDETSCYVMIDGVCMDEEMGLR